jgi:hypothetical protein
MSRIIIDQQLAAIGVSSTPAHVSISAPRLSMKITTEAAKMTVDSKNPEFRIDLQPYRDEVHLRQPDTLTADFGSHAQSAALGGTAETARDGDFLTRTDKPGNRVAQLARRKLQKSAQRELNIKAIPSRRPKVTWDPGYVHIDWSGHRISIDWEGDYMPELMVDPPYSIEVFLRNKPYFRITVEEGEDPYQAGQRVNQAV